MDISSSDEDSSCITSSHSSLENSSCQNTGRAADNKPTIHVPTNLKAGNSNEKFFDSAQKTP